MLSCVVKMMVEQSLGTELDLVLRTKLPEKLVNDLVQEYLAMRQDVATQTFGRVSAGKFVETVVQALQLLESGTYEAKPKVDDFLKNIESRSAPIDEGLRICVARIARAMYALRNKRSLAHKGLVDPNSYDLGFLLQGAQWILSEFVRLFAGSTMTEAGHLVSRIQAPVGGLVEDFGSRKLVLVNATASEQILLLLQSHYPDVAGVPDLIASMDRSSAGTVRNNLRALWHKKLIEKNGTNGYVLTGRGVREAVGVANKYVNERLER